MTAGGYGPGTRRGDGINRLSRHHSNQPRGTGICGIRSLFAPDRIDRFVFDPASGVATLGAEPQARLLTAVLGAANQWLGTQKEDTVCVE